MNFQLRLKIVHYKCPSTVHPLRDDLMSKAIVGSQFSYQEHLLKLIIVALKQLRAELFMRAWFLSLIRLLSINEQLKRYLICTVVLEHVDKHPVGVSLYNCNCG